MRGDSVNGGPGLAIHLSTESGRRQERAAHTANRSSRAHTKRFRRQLGGIGGEFFNTPVTVGVIPTMSGESRRAGCIGKWPIRQASVTRPIAGTQKPSLAAGEVFFGGASTLGGPPEGASEAGISGQTD